MTDIKMKEDKGAFERLMVLGRRLGDKLRRKIKENEELAVELKKTRQMNKTLKSQIEQKESQLQSERRSMYNIKLILSQEKRKREEKEIELDVLLPDVKKYKQIISQKDEQIEDLKLKLLTQPQLNPTPQTHQPIVEHKSNEIQLKQIYNVASSSPYAYLLKNIQNDDMLKSICHYINAIVSLLREKEKQVHKMKEIMEQRKQESESLDSDVNGTNMAEVEEKEGEREEQEGRNLQERIEQMKNSIQELEQKVVNLKEKNRFLLIQLENKQTELKEQSQKNIFNITPQKDFNVSQTEAHNLSTSTIKELGQKIDKFQAKNSIISKIKSSKFFNSSFSKMSFVIQYACLLQIYFSPSFLSTIRQELLMADRITLNKISEADLNSYLFIHSTAQTSFLNHSSSSKLNHSSSSKLNFSNQYELHTFSEKEPMRLELDQLNESIRKYYSLKNVQSNQKLAQELKKYKDNETAGAMLQLIEENRGMKKCINQMIKNEESLVELNNSRYFEESFMEEEEEKEVADKKECIIF